MCVLVSGCEIAPPNLVPPTPHRHTPTQYSLTYMIYMHTGAEPIRKATMDDFNKVCWWVWVNRSVDVFDFLRGGWEHDAVVENQRLAGTS